MKKIFFNIFLFFFCLFLMPQKASAHFSASNGTMTVVLHIDPFDEPIPGQLAVIHFLFEDSTQRFSLTKCTCSVTISEQGKKILSHVLTPTNQSKQTVWDNTIPFIFPNRDVYQITLRGKPKENNAFQPFTLTWYFRVDQFPQADDGQNDPYFVYFVIFYFGIFIVTGISLYFIFR